MIDKAIDFLKKDLMTCLPRDVSSDTRELFRWKYWLQKENVEDVASFLDISMCLI